MKPLRTFWLTEREWRQKEKTPVSPSLTLRSDSEVRLKEIEKELALKKWQFEDNERQRHIENDERQRQFDLRRLELELAAQGIQSPTNPGEQSPPHIAPRDISRYIR